MQKNTFPKNKKIIIGNWKMNPSSKKEAIELFKKIKLSKIPFKKSLPIICPPVIFLDRLIEKNKSKIQIGVQDVSFSDAPESTGEISVDMIKSFGVKFVLIGHAERRKMYDTNEIVAKKIITALKAGLNIVICIGEEERDFDGKYLRFIEKQIVDAFSVIDKKNLDKVIIAYEPLFAIGLGKNAVSAHEIYRMNLFIKKILSSIYEKEIAFEIPVLYGGSVDEYNMKEIITEGLVDGLLIGRSSLNHNIFLNILKNIEGLK